MNVLSFGEILWDVIEGEAHLGGAPLNFAAHTAQCGNQSFIISRLGKDLLGEKAFASCKTFGVGTSFIQWDEQHRTGVVDVTLHNGQPDYIIHEQVAYDFIQYDAALEKLPNDYFDVFYFGSLIQRNDISTGTLLKILNNHHFGQIFYDVNLRKKGYTAAIIKRSLPYCTILKLNIDEVPELANLLWSTASNETTFCQRLSEAYPNINSIIITAADKGCMVYFNNQLVTVPGVAVRVADAVGAGDAFSAAFMHSFLQHGDSIKAAQVANRMGAFVASQHGPIPVYSNEIRELLSTQH
jgi:fructokinase